MLKSSALKKYKDSVDSKILNSYLDADEHILFNEDDFDLATIKYELPKCPDWDQIDNFGLPRKQQKWKPPEFPVKLKEAERIVVKEKLILGESATIDDIWDFLEKNKKEYSECIDWIEKQWDRRLNGYWFFNNGKPTYIDGWQYFYCGFWNLDVGLPEYRGRDRSFFHFSRMCYVDTYGIVCDDEGNPVSDDGEIELIDIEKRICFGFNYPKHRRDGATYKAECINYEIISRMSNAMGGIQSMTGDSARKAFIKHLVRPWKKLPFFFKPNYDGSTDPKRELIFDKPGVKIGGKGSVLTIDVGLESVINYAETASASFYDGEKLYYYHGDESGKTKQEDVRERHDIIKECLALGSGTEIHGLCINTSTVEEMVDKGGQAFYDLCEDSHYEKRNENNQTVSGLYNLFIPAYDGLQGYVDEFGDSVIEDPEHPILNSSGKEISIGAKTYLENIRKALVEKNTAKSIEDFYRHCRLYPQSYAECFIGSGEDSGMPKQIIIQRIAELNRESNTTITGNFEWESGIFGGNVVWVPNPEGRFQVSKLLPPSEANLKYIKNDVFYPFSPKKFTACADIFKFNKPSAMRIKGIRNKGRLSDGAGAVFWERDYKIDPDSKDVSEWESHRFCCTYSNRLRTKAEFCEDMLKMCIFHGAMMYPEINVPDVWDKFVEWGFAGYLKYDVDEKTGKIKDNPGFHSGEHSKQDLFLSIKDYLEVHGIRERHIDFLTQCKDIRGTEEMTAYDLFTACGGALLGSQSSYSKVVEESMTEYDLGDYIKMKKY